MKEPLLVPIDDWTQETLQELLGRSESERFEIKGPKTDMRNRDRKKIAGSGRWSTSEPTGDTGKARSIDSVYGSTWLTATTGSVLALWGTPGVGFKRC